jgi:hypothetical protein
MADRKNCKNDYLGLGYAVGYGIGRAESFGCKEIKSIILLFVKMLIKCINNQFWWCD